MPVVTSETQGVMNGRYNYEREEQDGSNKFMKSSFIRR